MSAPAFTPGPWTCFYKSKYDEWHVSLPMTGGSMKLALCPDGIQSENPGADAHLIAAAPELFEALESLIYDARLQMANPSHHMPFSLVKAEAAIAKASGTPIVGAQ